MTKYRVVRSKGLYYPERYITVGSSNFKSWQKFNKFTDVQCIKVEFETKEEATKFIEKEIDKEKPDEVVWESE